MHNNAVKFLIALKNASLFKKELVFCFFNQFFIKLAKILYKEGLIQDFWIYKTVQGKFSLVIVLKYTLNLSNLSNLKIVSKPSWSMFLTFKEICKIYEKKSVLVFSTNKGFLNSFECKKKKIGGKLFFYVK